MFFNFQDSFLKRPAGRRRASWGARHAFARASAKVAALKEGEGGRVQILLSIMRVRVQVSAGFVMGAASCKNCDEPINYTVRVMLWRSLIVMM